LDILWFSAIAASPVVRTGTINEHSNVRRQVKVSIFEYKVKTGCNIPAFYALWATQNTIIYLMIFFETTRVSIKKTKGAFSSFSSRYNLIRDSVQLCNDNLFSIRK